MSKTIDFRDSLMKIISTMLKAPKHPRQTAICTRSDLFPPSPIVVNFEVRYFSRNGQKELVHWHPVRCNRCRSSSDLRIFRGTLGKGHVHSKSTSFAARTYVHGLRARSASWLLARDSGLIERHASRGEKERRNSIFR